MKRTKRAAAVLTAALIAMVGFGAPPAQADDTSAVSILHGVPGAVVDVWANGKPLLTNFKPGTLTEPQMLPAGSYDIKIVQAGAGADGAAVIQAEDLQVPAGANLTLAAHLDASGAPVLTAFTNDTSASTEGSRLTVRHLAAAPAVDIRAGGTVVIENLVNPKEAVLDLAPGTVSADVVLADTDTVAIGPADVTLTKDMNTIVYAWGSAEGKNLALAVQQVGIGSRGMPSTGVADDQGAGAPWALLVAGGLAAIVVAAMGRRTAGQRQD
ncbi:DUF4397 domain-containing protein [Aestuariimicrobium sp. Y1814]|uniref:DUF4397 domain-containing protein n=1 Tax=Aestuariimicrobium sp. Y1814 TaxID=3418742 RepID=UPI003DA701B7